MIIYSYCFIVLLFYYFSKSANFSYCGIKNRINVYQKISVEKYTFAVNRNNDVSDNCFFVWLKCSPKIKQ